MTPLTILHPIGSGAMSEVFAARLIQTGEVVALKRLRQEFRGDLDITTRFVNEALPLLHLDLRHPGLPRIIDCQVPPDDAPFILMELLHEPLSARLRRAPLPRAVALDIVAQLASTLSAIHAASVVHRDIKPGNVMRCAPSLDRVKLVDFGLAKALAGSRLHALPVFTTRDASLGSAIYMAPEQALDAGDVDPRSDIYSLGVLLYELLAGAPPFQAPKAGRLRVLHMMAPPPPLTHLDPPLPEALTRLLAGMLDKDRRGRPGADDVVSALASLAPPGSAP